MAMEGVSKGRLIGAIIGFVMAFIGTALLWNVFDKDVPNLNDDQKGSINFYIFAVWIMAAACIFAVIKAESFHVHNAVVIFAFTMFASFFVAVPSPPDARISLSFATLTAVRLTLLAVPVADVCLCVRARMCVCVYVYKQTRLTIVTLSRPPPSPIHTPQLRDSANDGDSFRKLFGGGILANVGMLLCLLCATLRKNISDSGKIIKLICTAVVVVCCFIGIVIFWSTDNISKCSEQPQTRW